MRPITVFNSIKSLKEKLAWNLLRKFIVLKPGHQGRI
jgi:hypothetical protein